MQLLKFLENYFGILVIPLIIIVFLDIMFLFLRNKDKKIFYKTRLFFSVIFIVVVCVNFVLLECKYFSVLDEANIIKKSLLEYHLGFTMTYLITTIYEKIDLRIVFSVSAVIIIISLFFLTAKEIVKFFKHLKKKKDRKRAMKLQQALLKRMESQIAIKEELEQKKTKDYEKQQMHLEDLIKEKVELAVKKNLLPISTDLNDIEDLKQDKEKEKDKKNKEKNNKEEDKKQNTEENK